MMEKCALRKNKEQTVSTSALLKEERVHVAAASSLSSHEVSDMLRLVLLLETNFLILMKYICGTK